MAPTINGEQVSEAEATTVANEEAAAVAESKAPKKAAKKVTKKAAKAPKAAKKGAKKAPAKAAKKAAKKAPTGEKKAREGLGRPRTLILKALKASSKGLTRGEISEKTGINSGFTSLLGHEEPANREEGSLLKLGYITLEVIDDKGKDKKVYKITEKGRKALEAEKA